MHVLLKTEANLFYRCALSAISVCTETSNKRAIFVAYYPRLHHELEWGTPEIIMNLNVV